MILFHKIQSIADPERRVQSQPHGVLQGRASWMPNHLMASVQTSSVAGPPLNSQGLGLDCVTAMYQVCLLDKSLNFDRLELPDWTLPQYDVRIKVTAQSVIKVTWAIYYLFDEMVSAAGYWPSSAWLLPLERVPTIVQMAHRDIPFVPPGQSSAIQRRALNESDIFNVGETLATAENATTPLNSSSQSWDEFQIPIDDDGISTITNLTTATNLTDSNSLRLSIRFNGGVSIPNKNFFRDMLSSMGSLASSDPKTDLPVNSAKIFTNAYGVTARSYADEYGHSAPSVKNFYGVMRQMALWMVQERRYAACEFLVSKNRLLLMGGAYVGSSYT